MIEYLPLVLTGLGLTASIVYYAGVLRNANKTQKQQLETRQAQLFMNIYSYVYTMEFWTYYRELTEQWEWEDYDDWYKKYRSDTDTYNKFAVVGTYFEGMGVLVKRNLIEITFVDDLMSGPIMQFWQKFEPIILEERRRRKPPLLLNLLPPLPLNLLLLLLLNLPLHPRLRLLSNLQPQQKDSN